MFSRSIRTTGQPYLPAGETTARIDLAAVLAERLAGEVIAPDHPEYDGPPACTRRRFLPTPSPSTQGAP
jgi:hypothetical protein